MSTVTSWSVATDTSTEAGLDHIDFGAGADLSQIAGANHAHPALLSAADGNRYSFVQVTGSVASTGGTPIHRGERVAGTVWTLVGDPVPLPATNPPPPANPPPSTEVEQLRQLLVDAIVHIKATAAIAAALGGGQANPAAALIGLIEVALGLAASSLPPSVHPGS